VTPLVLEARGVRSLYPGGIVGLDGASLTLHAGEKLALLGPNGSGKTTLLLHLCGVLPPSEGEIRLEGRPLDYTRAGLRELRRMVGTVLQDADEQLFAPSVYEDVSFGPLNLGLAEAEVRLRVDEALAQFGIADLADRPPHRLSLGQKKRAALAGVVAMHPRVILLDEPTAGLDPAGAAETLAVLELLHRGGTQITFATHDVDLAYGWADRVAVLGGGRVLACGPPQDILRRSDLLETARLRIPTVAAMVDSLQALGLWPADAAPPRSLEALQDCLEQMRASTCKTS
jgi:cobalt/nickel transport system ATP-binding protein